MQRAMKKWHKTHDSRFKDETKILFDFEWLGFFFILFEMMSSMFSDNAYEDKMLENQLLNLNKIIQATYKMKTNLEFEQINNEIQQEIIRQVYR